MHRLVFLTLFALPLVAEAPLTNDDITALVKAGLTASVIEEKISASPVAFDVSTAGLVALSKAGVPQSVIKAMIAASKNPPAPTTTALPAAASPAPAASPVIPAAPRRFTIKAIGPIDACLGTLEISATTVWVSCTWRHSRQYTSDTIPAAQVAKHCYYRSKIGLGKDWLFVTTHTKPQFYQLTGTDMDEAFRYFRELNPDVPSSANCSMRDLRTEF